MERPVAEDVEGPGQSVALTNDVRGTTVSRDADPPDRRPAAWNLYRGLALQALILVPLRDMFLSEVMQMRSGTVLRSSWPATSDVMLYIHDALLGRVSLEPAESRLGFRLNSLALTKAEKHVLIDRDAHPDRNQDAATEGLHSMRTSVSLCLGTKRMDLEEILSITLGDLVALDRGLDEEVTILVGRRVLALGTLILIDGCYAVEVAQMKLTNASLPGTGLMPTRLGNSGAQVLKAGGAAGGF